MAEAPKRICKCNQKNQKSLLIPQKSTIIHKTHRLKIVQEIRGLLRILFVCARSAKLTISNELFIIDGLMANIDLIRS
jgi:hypothetical protein